MNRTLVTVLTGLGTAVAVGLGLTFLLGVAPAVSGALGLVMGGGMALMTRPGAARKIEAVQIAPTTTDGMLDACASRADEMQRQMGRLTSRQLWAGSKLDERIGEMLDGIRNLAQTPAVRGRATADGDVQTLYLLATDYLPTLVNLAIENDRMHSTFRGAGSRKGIVDNVQALDEQSAILGEALDQIEQDVVRGVSRDAAQHAAFLASRFEQARSGSLLDLKHPLSPAVATPPNQTDTSPNGARE